MIWFVVGFALLLVYISYAVAEDKKARDGFRDNFSLAIVAVVSAFGVFILWSTFSAVSIALGSVGYRGTFVTDDPIEAEKIERLINQNGE